MFFKKIQSKIHRLLFSEFDSSLSYLRMMHKIQQATIDELTVTKNDLINQLTDAKKIPIPTMADLMRANLGLVTLDFSNVEKDGYPKHFLDVDAGKRTQYINELHQISQFEVWPVMCKNHIDTQGNFSFRNADGELQMLAGRMSVNGISLIKDEVKKGHDEYMERSNPANKDYSEDDPERFEIGEGIIIKKDNEVTQ